MGVKIKLLEAGNCYRDEEDLLHVMKAGEIYPREFDSADDVPKSMGPFEIVVEEGAKPAKRPEAAPKAPGGEAPKKGGDDAE